MEVRPVLRTHDMRSAHSVCEELRAHDIKCDTVEPSLPDVTVGRTFQNGIQVVVAPKDERHAKEVLRAWLHSLASDDSS
jgi:hypothetical protein